jgi:hypothetical protein
MVTVRATLTVALALSVLTILSAAVEAADRAGALDSKALPEFIGS